MIFCHKASLFRGSYSKVVSARAKEDQVHTEDNLTCSQTIGGSNKIHALPQSSNKAKPHNNTSKSANVVVDVGWTWLQFEEYAFHTTLTQCACEIWSLRNWIPEYCGRRMWPEATTPMIFYLVLNDFGRKLIDWLLKKIEWSRQTKSLNLSWTKIF